MEQSLSDARGRAHWAAGTTRAAAAAAAAAAKLAAGVHTRSGLFVPVVALLLAAAVPASAEGGKENAGPASAPRALDREGLTAEIVATWRAQADERGLSLAAWEADMERALSTKDDGQLLAIKSAKSRGSVLRQLNASPPPVSPCVLGDGATDLVYFPLTQCRILDTRTGTGTWAGPLAPASTTAGNVNFALFAQGGNAAGCDVPTDPTAIAATVTALTPAGQGHLKIFPFLGTEPNASVINYASVAGLNLANTTIFRLCQLCGEDFNIKVAVSATHVLVDVVGYFWNPSIGGKAGFVWAAVHVTGATPTVTRVTTGEYQVSFGADVSTRHYAVSLGNSATGVPSAGNCSATPSTSSANEVYVDRYVSSGTGADNNFYPQVF